MSWADLIWNILSGFGTNLVFFLLIIFLLIAILIIVFKKRKTFDKAREWLFEPIKKNLDDTEAKLNKAINEVRMELVNSNFERLRRELIIDVAFITSSVKDNTWTENMFQNYAHMLGAYARLSSLHSLRDGEVITSLRQVDKLYEDTHNGTPLFGEDMISNIQTLLVK